MTYKKFRANDIKYPLAMETISDEDIDALSEWLKSYPKLTKGDLTLEFEKLWADYVGTKYAVFCNSGSSANLLMVYAALHNGHIENKKDCCSICRVGYHTISSNSVWLRTSNGRRRSKYVWHRLRPA